MKPLLSALGILMVLSSAAWSGEIGLHHIPYYVGERESILVRYTNKISDSDNIDCWSEILVTGVGDTFTKKDFYVADGERMIVAKKGEFTKVLECVKQQVQLTTYLDKDIVIDARTRVLFITDMYSVTVFPGRTGICSYLATAEARIVNPETGLASEHEEFTYTEGDVISVNGMRIAELNCDGTFLRLWPV